ncbi:hypothetical protein Smp_196280 [Schistosoma mansoni]|uniref:hypothetical protein n=1 Tax=Schistosoma mansoni TaxID=6183 RepID=UPI00022DC269|nr:hypothetical protein Smp_196280 [Schistosoma mansoni]|eukprot:XP_018648251.1 hypothetical protein Smp_196280 [Schistosoma mansoni]
MAAISTESSADKHLNPLIVQTKDERQQCLSIFHCYVDSVSSISFYKRYMLSF